MSQGTDSLLELAADLRAAAPMVRSAYNLGLSAKLIERAADAIERLAPLEPDLEAQPGEN